MRATFHPLGQWPGPSTTHRRSRNTFSASWSDTLRLLDDELTKLDAHNVVIQADFREQDIRLDGMPKSGARVPAHPGVILSFESTHGPLQYATDAHEWWEHNVRAIALGLKALRAVDRYGITKRGEQYTGWKQLTAGSGITTREAATELIARLSGVPIRELRESGLVRDAYRQALKKAHPDLGGTAELLASVRDAGRILGVAS